MTLRGIVEKSIQEMCAKQRKAGKSWIKILKKKLNMKEKSTK